MKLQIRGRNAEITPVLKDYIEKRVGKLNKYLNNLSNGQVVLTVERGRNRVEVTLPIDGMILRGEESTGDIYTSVDLVVEKLEKQIEKFKGRYNRRPNKQYNKNVSGVPSLTEAEEKEQETFPGVVKTKRFAMKPMTTEEAILQIDLLGHNFFVFSNAETEQVNVLYRRKDGNYGLIEPEF
jgi:putative sigma-54 modulation protein